jgi:hypothetical protein
MDKLKVNTWQNVNGNLMQMPYKFTYVSIPSSTGSIQLPKGTSAQRPTGVAGKIRYNSELNQFEGHNGTAWGAIGAGATGGVGNYVFFENDLNITANYTITSGKNAMTAGPVTISDGITVTVPDGSVWTIV